MKNKLLILKGRGESHKYRRLVDELGKTDLVFEVIDCHLTTLSAKVTIENIKEYDFVISLENQTYCNYLINYFSLVGFKTWPNFFNLKINDKFLQAQFLESIGIPHPKTILLNTLDKNELIKRVKNGVGGFPCVIKKVTGSFGNNVAKVGSVREIEDFIKNKNGRLKLIGKNSYLLQEFIEEAQGEDYRVLMLKGDIIGGIKRKTSNSSDFRANISLGGKGEYFEVPERVKVVCRDIYKKTNCFYLGIDLIKKGSEWYVIELNPCAQFQGFEKATGINIAKKIVEALEFETKNS